MISEDSQDIAPSGPTMSDTWDTVVPERTLAPGFTGQEPMPPTMPAPNFERNGFHTRYSILGAEETAAHKTSEIGDVGYS